jgi:chromosome segregation ATPase
METALATQTEVGQQSELEILEENYLALKEEIKTLDQSAWIEMKSLDSKQGTSTFDPDRYRSLKKKLQDRLPILETRLRKERIRSLQSHRVELEKELEGIQPQQLKTKAAVHEAQRLLDRAWQEHARLDLKAASIESQLAIDFEELRTNQRALQDLIQSITGVEDLDHDGLSANAQNNLLI